MVRWAWGSRSMRQTVLPISARAAPRLTVVVVLPTPPFWFIRAMVRMRCHLRGRGTRPWTVLCSGQDYEGDSREYKKSHENQRELSRGMIRSDGPRLTAV